MRPDKSSFQFTLPPAAAVLTTSAFGFKLLGVLERLPDTAKPPCGRFARCCSDNPARAARKRADDAFKFWFLSNTSTTSWSNSAMFSCCHQFCSLCFATSDNNTCVLNALLKVCDVCCAWSIFGALAHPANTARAMPDNVILNTRILLLLSRY